MTVHSAQDTEHDVRDDAQHAHRWATLPRSVAGGMIASFAFVMIVVAQSFVPPLAVAGVLFAIPLAVSLWRPRVAAIAIGAGRDLADFPGRKRLAGRDRPRPPGGHGHVRRDGRDGDLRGRRRARARRPAAQSVGNYRDPHLQATGAIVGLAAIIGLVAGVAAEEAPLTVSDGDTTVTLHTIEFQPANLQVPAGSDVTWQWADGQIEHDVVAEGFASEIKTDGTFTHTFETPGTYSYVCSIHPTMTGTVTVVEEA